MRTKCLLLPNVMTYNIHMAVLHLDINVTCCLSGHRPKALPWKYNEEKISCIKFKNDLEEYLIYTIKNGFINFLIGMAEGFDMISAETLITLRTIYKQIRIYAIIPCKNQEIKWSLSQQQRYHRILKQCDDVIILSEQYTKNCMNVRNEYMVKLSSMLIACYNGKPSGTGNTIKFAQKQNLKILLINPNDYEKYK